MLPNTFYPRTSDPRNPIIQPVLLARLTTGEIASDRTAISSLGARDCPAPLGGLLVREHVPRHPCPETERRIGPNSFPSY
jgi:hypothetical protein